MKRNIIVSIAAHIVISLICFACFLIEVRFVGKLENRTVYILGILLVLCVCFTYFFTGRYLQKPVEGKNRSFISACALGLILMLIVLIGIVINITTSDGNLGSFIISISNPAANSILIFIEALIYKDYNPNKLLNLYFLLTPLLPTAGILTGLVMKKRSLKKKQRAVNNSALTDKQEG